MVGVRMWLSFADGKEHKRLSELASDTVRLHAPAEVASGRGIVRHPARSLYQGREKMDRLERQMEAVRQENRALKQRLKELAAAVKTESPAAPPAFVKANVCLRPAGNAQRARPAMSRRIGHCPRRSIPTLRFQSRVTTKGLASCPECRTQLSDVNTHQRIVEDFTPAKMVVTCYHTTSGYCPSCRKVVESRALRTTPGGGCAAGAVGDQRPGHGGPRARAISPALSSHHAVVEGSSRRDRLSRRSPGRFSEWEAIGWKGNMIGLKFYARQPGGPHG